MTGIHTYCSQLSNFISVDRHSILVNVGWLVCPLVGPSLCEDNLSNCENMHKNAVIHDDTSNHDDENDPANHYDSEKHDSSDI